MFLSFIHLALVLLLLGDRASLSDMSWCSFPVCWCDVHVMDVAQVEVELSSQLLHLGFLVLLDLS